MANELKSDGNLDFSGGMDSYRSPSLLSENQYYAAINCQIKPGINGISTRSGFRELRIVFEDEREEEIFRSKNIQGCNYYIHEGVLLIIVSCNGRIYELEQVDKFTFKARFVQRSNNPNNRNAWITKVPRGVIINDGESAPIKGSERNYSRISGKTAIGAGRAGAYIQNRFFYISGDGTSVKFSTINNSTSLEEPINNNISGGFLTPDDTEIKAVGMQRFIRKDTNGGSLLFSTRDNVYSVNVNGPMDQWGKPGSDLGVVSASVFDIGAVSPYSFLPLNSNVYFRNKNLGIASMQYLQYIWDNTDILETQSFGAHLFFDNDDDYLLDSCYSVRYKNSIFTTVSPSLHENSVYWNGFISMKPEQKGIISYHSLITGIRPWCMQNIIDSDGTEYMYIFSHDKDGVNRLYMIDDNLDYDLKADGTRKNIESKLCTRFFQYQNGFAYKKAEFCKFVVSQKSSKLDVRISTRHASENDFKDIYAGCFIKQNCASKDEFVNAVPQNNAFQVTYPDRFGELNSFLEQQDLIKLTGSFNLSKLIRLASQIKEDNTITKNTTTSFQKLSPLKFFDYNIYG